MTPPARRRAQSAVHGLLFIALTGCAAQSGRLGGRLAGPEMGPAVGVGGLVGATPAVLEAEFGPPLLLRQDGPAQVWLYRSSRCAVDIILYRDPASGAARVATADARPLGAPLSDAECLASLGTMPDKTAGRIASGSE